MSTLERGTRAVIKSNATSHGFPLGTQVILDHYDHEGDAVWKEVGRRGSMWYVKLADLDFDPGATITMEISITTKQLESLVEAAQAAEDAALADSNDEEIETLREAYEAAYSVLGIKIPDGREPCDYCSKPGVHTVDGDPRCDDHKDD